MINSTRLEYFMALAQAQTFTQAAQELYISQPALSKQISLLEQELGVQLFERSTRGLTLTFAGRILYDEALGIIKYADDMVHRVRIAGRVNSFTLRVGTMTPWAELTLPPYIHEYRQQHVNVTVNLQRYVPSALFSKLRSGEVDVILFRTFKKTGTAEFNHKLLKKTRLCVVVHRSHPFARRESVGIAELKNQSIAMVSRKVNQESHNDMMELCRKAGFRPNIAVECSLVESLYPMVLSQSMVTILSGDMEDYVPHSLVFVRLEESNEAELFALWRKEEENPYVQDFISILPAEEG